VSLFDRFQDLVHDGPRWARPQVVLSALLAVALLAQVGTIAWPVLRNTLDARTGQGAVAPVASGAAITLRPGLSVATIIAGHLFGAAQPEAGPPERTALPLELMGTFAALDPATGMAFLREGPGGPQQFYRVGETLPGGGVLREIYSTRIVFAREGRMEELTFPERRLAFAAPPSLASLTRVTYARASFGAPAVAPEDDIDEALRRTPEEQYEAARGVPQWQSPTDLPGGSGAARTESPIGQD
jgi:general secretion pathway protein C